MLVDGKLAALLVRLNDEAHDPLLRGAWYIEAGFGLLDGQHQLFASLEEAAASIEHDLYQPPLIMIDDGPLAGSD